MGLTLFLGLIDGASASQITFRIDFETQTRSFDNTKPLIIGGVMFTPVTGHYDIIFWDGSWEFNIDDGGDLGDAISTTIKVTNTHGPFTLRSLVVIENSGDFSIISSTGGDTTPVVGAMDFGADFADISSFDLVQRSDGGFLGIDDIVITTAAVPEPASIVLLGTGLLALSGLRRRNRTGRKPRAVAGPGRADPFMVRG